ARCRCASGGSPTPKEKPTPPPNACHYPSSPSSPGSWSFSGTRPSPPCSAVYRSLPTQHGPTQPRPPNTEGTNRRHRTIDPLLAHLTALTAEVRRRWRIVRATKDGGYSTEAVLVTAVLVVLAVVVLGIIAVKVTLKASSINLG